jgi:hypothetical protein
MSQFSHLREDAPWRQELWKNIKENAKTLLIDLNQQAYEGKALIVEDGYIYRNNHLTDPNAVLGVNMWNGELNTFLGICLGNEKDTLRVIVGHLDDEDESVHTTHLDIVFAGEWHSIEPTVVKALSQYVALLREKFRVTFAHIGESKSAEERKQEAKEAARLSKILRETEQPYVSSSLGLPAKIFIAVVVVIVGLFALSQFG